MKRILKPLCLLLATVLLFTLLAACSPAATAPQAPKADYGAGNSAIRGEYDFEASYDVNSAEAEAAPTPMPSALPESGFGTDTAAVTDLSQKIIYNAYLQLETKSFDGVKSSIEAKAASLGGYVESSNVNGKKPVQYGDNGRYLELTMRIPSDKLDKFLSDLKSEADLISESINSQNITQTYYDAQSRKETLEIQLERLESILAQSDNLADILALETEISRVRSEIESLTTSLRRWDNQVSYSTVTIFLQELTTFDRPQSNASSFSERLSQSGSSGWVTFVNGLEDFAVWFVGALPILVLLAVIAIAILLIVRASIKRSAKRRLNDPRANKSPYQSKSETNFKLDNVHSTSDTEKNKED